MEGDHVKSIQLNINKLIEVSDFETMSQACVEKEIFTQTMIDNMDREGSDDENKQRLLFDKITHRGPTAFHKLLDILKAKGFDEVHSLLSIERPSKCFFNDEPDMPRNSVHPAIVNSHKGGMSSDGGGLSCFGNSKQKQLKSFTTRTSFRFGHSVEVKKAEAFGLPTKIPVYNMKSRKRGVFFYVNNIHFDDGENRNEQEAEEDKENLITLFSEMNFTVYYFEDLTKSQFDEKVKLLIAHHLKQVDSFVFCIQTINMKDNNTVLKFSDGFNDKNKNKTNVEDVISLFANDKCSVLVLKPKVFFLPSHCGVSTGVAKNLVPSVVPDRIVDVPSFSDILICYQTDKNYFVTLCRTFAQHAAHSHIENLMKMVSMTAKPVEGRIHVDSENRGFNKLLFFNPKIFG